MRKLLLIIFLLLPFSVLALNLWTENIISDFYSNLMPYSSYSVNFGNPVRVLGFWNILDTELPNYDIVIGCDGNYQDIYFGNIFLPLNLYCQSFTIYNNSDEFVANFITYFQEWNGETKISDSILIENLETGSNFYLDKTISYGDILVVIFLSIFMIFIICKAIANFIFKQWN